MIDGVLVKISSIMKEDTISDAVEKVVTKTAYIASGVTVFSGLTVNEWGVVVGATIAIITAGFNIWFKMKYLRPKARSRSVISERRKHEDQDDD